jgi:hypothetical protein
MITRTPRQEIELRVMSWLNDRQEYWTHYFDCGELGIMRIYWRHGWEIEWATVAPCPVEIAETVDDQG